ncbi:PAS domain S-box protein [Streptomyces sp. NPDC094468]|uniref:PAS domain S-box protein n=1 Tax=Streptomyces sp. NPDC094468 TaxID=3366066 RepID=UPI00381E9402
MTDLADVALQAAGDAVVTADTTGHITSWNAAAEHLFGRKATDVVGQSLALLVPERFRPRHAAGFHAALENQSLSHRGKPAHILATTATGEEVSMYMTLGLLAGENGEPSGVVAVLRYTLPPPVAFV